MEEEQQDSFGIDKMHGWNQDKWFRLSFFNDLFMIFWFTFFFLFFFVLLYVFMFCCSAFFIHFFYAYFFFSIKNIEFSINNGVRDKRRLSLAPNQCSRYSQKTWKEIHVKIDKGSNIERRGLTNLWVKAR